LLLLSLHGGRPNEGCLSNPASRRQVPDGLSECHLRGHPYRRLRHPNPVIAPQRLHPAWIVLGAVTLCMMAGSGLRSVFGVYIKPMEAELGWSRGALSSAAAVSLLLLGAAGPAVGWLADRYGPRRVIVVSLLMRGIGAIGASFVQKLWHVYVTTGLLMALGAGGLAITTGSTVAARWFEARRGVAIGIAAGGMSAGQL